ncbi:histidine kinase dimerization/phosphoacceptor domain -containing protein [Gymnodinialimonas sp. 57CJ19]|uniref:sensor histidine kinase n=1 Tax=Gymnodinialimonas sp. 57CJ19 TaxID=3138498 RepID=UPI00313438A7
MTTFKRLWRSATSLKARLALFLSLAILPLGIIAVVQTTAVVRDARFLEQHDILARTAQAASAEQALLRRAHGAATALGAAATIIGTSGETCAAAMERFVEQSQAYIYAGYSSITGDVSCANGREGFALADRAEWQDFIERPRPMITVEVSDEDGGPSVIVATAPVFDPATLALLGAASVAMPNSLTDTLLASEVEDVELALIDDTGQVLSASTGITDIEIFETLSVAPDDLGMNSRGVTFNVVAEDGTQRLAALVPLIEDRVYVLGLWHGEVQNYSVSVFGSLTPLFPILMWVMAFGVGFLALNRLILRHLKEIRRRMAAFSFENPSAGVANLDDPPDEFRQIATTYNGMIKRMQADRDELEENLEEKELLLREVHHRVKNNLQLIASILNMQMRAAPDSTSKWALRRVQDRVMSLSTIHKALYTGTSMVHVWGDKLLEEVVQATFNVGVPQGEGIRTSLHLDPLKLDPDQAVPLALLANETVTNAVKYIGRPENGPPTLDVRLVAGANREVTLTVENSTGVPIQENLATESTGLGIRLVEAFVSQLGGEWEVIERPGTFCLKMVFTAFDLAPEPAMPDADPSVSVAKQG